MQNVTVATCNLNQWAMDFEGNRDRILQSIDDAARDGCTFRTGPELEITGYGCEDFFLEHDTFMHSWQMLGSILGRTAEKNILIDIGMPVMHRNVAYNCRVFIYKGKIQGIRPKMYMANDGNYREMRHFTPWYVDPSEPGYGPLQDYPLPEIIRKKTGQTSCPIGIFAIQTKDATVATETCEELFTPDAPHIYLGLDGIDIIANGSASHHQLRKLNKRIDLIKSATAKGGGAYLYANAKGCDGGRLYFDGCSMIWVNGELVAQASQFGPLEDVEVVYATINLEEVRSFRSNFIARSYQASSAPRIPRIEVDCELKSWKRALPSPVIEARLHDPMEEIAYGPSAWLWDYLRRSGMRGYFLPLSGGADSSSTAAIVAIMCQRVVQEINEGSKENKEKTLLDVRKVTKRKDYVPADAKDLCGKIFVTCYMASKFSGAETRDRAEKLAENIGSIHTSICIDAITAAFQSTFENVAFHTDKVDKAKVKTKPSMDGEKMENIALQNIQARSRMVMAYYMAQLMPWATDGDETVAGGSLLVLGSANVDEALRGYYTKYDCSAADINPIGGINKRDLKSFLVWAGKNKGIEVLQRVADAAPSAELTGAEGVQSDEVDMGMSYEELGDLGLCRKVHKCGPVSAFYKLCGMWGPDAEHGGRALTPSIRVEKQPDKREREIAQKVKDFYFYHAINRHKMTTLTPSYHAENYSPDDNRFDLRPFLQNARYDLQFRTLDDVVRGSEPFQIP